jgi:hypothetical protein
MLNKILILVRAILVFHDSRMCQINHENRWDMKPWLKSSTKQTRSNKKYPHKHPDNIGKHYERLSYFSHTK